MKRYEKKVVIVTGAGSGIGYATALRLASEGAAVYGVDLNQEGLDALAAELGEQGATCKVSSCDVSSEDDVNSAVADCVASLGRLDTLVHMAGILFFDNTAEIPADKWRKLIDVNVTGTFLLAKATLPELEKTGGSIINAASTAALAGLPYGSAYSASKGAVLAFSRSIAVEYAKRGVRVNCVCPGDIQTGMTADIQFPEGMDFKLLERTMSLLGPTGPEALAGVIAMLGSEDGKHITGESILVDGGILA